MLKKILAGVAAAFTTPEAVKAEKTLAVVVITRLIITLGGTAAFVDVVAKLLGA